MNLLQKIGVYAALAVALFGAGFFTGWTEKSIRIEAAKVEPLQEARRADQAAVIESIKADQALQAKTDASDDQIDAIKKEIQNHVPATKPVYVYREVYVTAEREHEDTPESTDPAPVVCPSDTLSINAVRLLNAATTTDTDTDPITYLHAEGETPSPIGLRELSDHYLETVKQYHELAAWHDELVEYQEKQLKLRQQFLE
jgi:hypothetical protein